MFRLFGRTSTLVLLGGLVLGVLAALGAEQFDRVTSTDAFCTSCHAMRAYVADDQTFLDSAHRTAASGVRPTCADCHIPKGLVVASYTHVVNGIGDLYGQIAYDYDDPSVWQQRRPQLAHAVRDWMRANDSITCRSCHLEAAIEPARQRGKRAHAEAGEQGMTCIDCHYNLVHEPVEPRESFLDSAGRS